ncbi:MAG: alpha/beta hydrolase [Myxococcales bacterium]|nr:alpha/beta hydrolase [Myxococcales bacterium]
MTGLRYRAIVDALRSLGGPPHFSVVPPTETVRYRTPRRGVPPLADVYVPASPSGAGVVLVHGGGFVLGTRAMKPMRFLAARLVAAGVTVCSIDYRLIFRGGRLEEAVDDVRAAVEFFRGRSSALGLDAARVSLVGLSAGGTLAMLAAAREPLHRLVSCFGLYELDHLEGPLARVVPRLLFRSRDPRRWAARSPRHAEPPKAPTLLLHGDDDGLVPVAQARRLAAHREALGLPTRLVVYEGAPHGFFNAPCPAAEQAAREIVTHVTSGTGS